MILDPARLAEIHRANDDSKRTVQPGWTTEVITDLLAAHEALTAQVAALREALHERAEIHLAVGRSLMKEIAGEPGSLPDEWLTRETASWESVGAVLADTAAAAEAFTRQQRLKGARELMERSRRHWRNETDPATSRAVVEQEYTAMEREASA